MNRVHINPLFCKPTTSIVSSPLSGLRELLTNVHLQTPTSSGVPPSASLCFLFVRPLHMRLTLNLVLSCIHLYSGLDLNKHCSSSFRVGYEVRGNKQ